MDFENFFFGGALLGFLASVAGPARPALAAWSYLQTLARRQPGINPAFPVAWILR